MHKIDVDIMFEELYRLKKLYGASSREVFKREKQVSMDRLGIDKHNTFLVIASYHIKRRWKGHTFKTFMKCVGDPAPTVSMKTVLLSKRWDRNLSI